MPQDQGATPHGWLEASPLRAASDIVLAIIVLSAAAALLGVRDAPPSGPGELGPGFFPTVVGALLGLVGVVLLVRGIFLHAAQPLRWSPKAVAITAGVIAAAYLASSTWGLNVALLFGPAEFATLMILILTVAIALARISRVRAAGMALLGLLLATVGTEVSTGTERFTMGLDQLADGIMLPVVSLGLLVVADALICLVSPSLWLATYARRIAGWIGPRVPAVAGLGARLLAALAIAAACYFAFELNHTPWDVGVLIAFGCFGVAAKILGWNRPALILAAHYGPLLEENLRRASMISRGDPAVFLSRPISAIFALLVLGILATLAALSLRRLIRLRAAR